MTDKLLALRGSGGSEAKRRKFAEAAMETIASGQRGSGLWCFRMLRGERNNEFVKIRNTINADNPLEWSNSLAVREICRRSTIAALTILVTPHTIDVFAQL